jgi:hypothetical protein
MKKPLSVFMGGGKEEKVMVSGQRVGEFHLPPNPPVRNHFKKMLEKRGGFFWSEHRNGVGNGTTNGHANGHANEHAERFLNGVNGAANGVNGVNGHMDKIAERHVAFPVIFEDKAKTRTMEVRNAVSLKDQILWLSADTSPSSRSSTRCLGETWFSAQTN